MTVDAFRPQLTVAVVGQVDSGKSTMIGHLRYQCGCVTQRDMDTLTHASADRGKASAKFAWLSDTRASARARGLTLQVAETRLLTRQYELDIADTPGHKSLTKSTIAGLATTDHAVLVVDATEGVYEVGMMDEDGPTKEHALLAFAMGAKQLMVVVNKMDALATPYAQERFDSITTEVGAYLAKLGFQHANVQYIPVSAWHGENLARKSTCMPWYNGPTLLEALDTLTPPERAFNKPLRMPVQDVYEVAGVGVVVTGRVQTGMLQRSMQLSFGPSEALATVLSIESYHRHVTRAYTGMAVGVHVKGLTKYEIKRGSVLSDPRYDEAREAQTFTAQLVFLRHPKKLVQAGYQPIVHFHTAQAACKILNITALLDRQTGEVLEASTGADGEAGLIKVKTGDACLVVLEPVSGSVVVETFREYPSLGRIVVRDSGATIAVGVIRSVEKKGV